MTWKSWTYAAATKLHAKMCNGLGVRRDALFEFALLLKSSILWPVQPNNSEDYDCAKMTARDFQVVDAHTHFFSHTWLQSFYEKTSGGFNSIEAVAHHLGWDLPPVDPIALGKQWVEQQDLHGVERQVLFASKLNDAEYLAAAVRAFPDRLTGYVMIDPTQEDARNQTLYALNLLDMNGVLLFPAMHHFHAYDDRACVIYEEALANAVPIFVHFGQLRIPIYDKLGIPQNIDLRYSSPLDLKRVIGDFPEANFIIPHFGCGSFEEALTVAREFPNVLFDSSSSNSWIKPPATLADIFKRSLEVLGPQRILFGTDSSFFPRGWRKDIFDLQLGVLQTLGLDHDELSSIFGQNIKTILNIK